MKADVKTRILSIIAVILACACIAYSVLKQGYVPQVNLLFLIIVVMTIALQLTSVMISKGIAIDMASCFIYLAVLTQPIVNVYIVIVMSFLISRLLLIVLKHDYYLGIKFDVVLFYNISAQCIVASITYPFIHTIIHFTGLQQIFALLLFVFVSDALLTSFSCLVGVLFCKNIFHKMYLKMMLLIFVLDYLITAIMFLLRTSNGVEGLLLFSLFLLLMNGSIYNVMSGAEINRKLIRDSLTKAYNRRYFDEHITNYLRQKKKFALLFFDLDDFKSINDTYGHLVGDKVLVAFVDVIKGHLRKNDKLFRYAGDEFCIIFDNFMEAVNFQDRMNDKEILLDYRDHDIKIQNSISIGIIDYDGYSYSSLDELIRSVDERMYIDKHHKKQKKQKASPDR